MNEPIQLQSSLCLTCTTCLLAGDWPSVSIIRPKRGFSVTKGAGIGLFHVSVRNSLGKERYTVMKIECKQSLILACGSVDLEQTKLGSGRNL